MKYLWMLVLSMILCTACQDEESYVWDYSDFEENVNTDEIQVIKNYNKSINYAFFNIIVFSEKPSRWGSDNLIYFFEHDSVTCDINGQNIPVEYKYSNDSIYIRNLRGIKDNTKIRITFWGSWYYTDGYDPKYTEGEPVFIEKRGQTITLDYKGGLPYKAVDGYVKNEYENATFYVPTIKLEREHDKIIKSNFVEYKFGVEGNLISNNDSINIVPVFIDNKTIQLDYESQLEIGKIYKFSFAAVWYVKNMDGNWIKCEGFNEVFEKEVVPVDITIDSIAHSDFGATYPCYRQCNFLIDEYGKGYLYPGDLTTFRYLLGKDITVVVKESNSSDSISTPLYYNEEYEVLEYQLPINELVPATIYNIAFYNTQSGQLIYNYHFRTSMYRSFQEKWVSEELLTNVGTWGTPESSGLRINVWPVNERMDTYETCAFLRSRNQLPLIRFQSVLPEAWKNTKQIRMYSLDDIEISRDPENQLFGNPPLNAVYFCAIEHLLSDIDILNGEMEFFDNGHNWTWNVIGQIYTDYNKNKNKFGSLLDNYSDLSVAWGVGGNDFNIPPIDISYVLPGIDVETTTFENFVIPGHE